MEWIYQFFNLFFLSNDSDFKWVKTGHKCCCCCFIQEVEASRLIYPITNFFHQKILKSNGTEQFRIQVIHMRLDEKLSRLSIKDNDNKGVKSMMPLPTT